MRLKFVKILILLQLVTFIPTHETLKIADNELLSEIRLFKSSIQWFLSNEDYLMDKSESVLKIEFIKAMRTQNLDFKNVKSLNNALNLIINTKQQNRGKRIIQKQKQRRKIKRQFRCLTKQPFKNT